VNCVVVDAVTVLMVRVVDVVCVMVEVVNPWTVLMIWLLYVVKKIPVVLNVVLE
jgi:hypothetical protein